MKLTGKVAIITGGAGAIGAATGFAMVREGATVVIADIRATEARNIADQITEQGGTALPMEVDVRVASEVDRLVATAVQNFGRLDIMFNNAGLAVVKPASEHSDADWELVINTDLRGVFYGCRSAGQVMVKQRQGVILNTASIIGLGGYSYRAAYSAAKAGIVNLTRTLASEWALDGIRVNSIAPGYIYTDGFKDLAESDVLNLDNMRRRIPMGRLGSPEDVAAAAVFLASNAAAYITGVVLPVDGGYTAYSGAEPVASRPMIRMKTASEQEVVET